MAGRFEGKVALVTGGGSGIGRASAVTFAKEGAKVVVADVDVEAGKETVQMITKNGGDAIFVRADVSKEAEVETLINKTVETYGRLDCAFNSAGIEANWAGIVECTEEDWDRVIDINLKGTWMCMKYEIPQMVKCGGDAIVNASSIAGLVGFPGITPYVASKHGVVGLTKAVALEYAKNGIRINAICPAAVQTPMFERTFSGDRKPAAVPMGRVAAPEEVAEVVLWLCSDGASFVTGHPMSVDGGYVAR